MEVKVRCPHCKNGNKFRGLAHNRMICFHCRREFTIPTVGQYLILEQLGEGGFGVVYRGYEPGLEREVAIKIMHPRSNTSVEELQRFEKEAKLTAQINHPHVAPVFHYGKHGDQFYLVSALISGKELKHYITKKGFPEVAQAVAYAITLLETLQDVHEKYSIWHRDVKPSNIMITDRGVVYLLDFGIASSQDPDLPKLTQSGYPLGTPYYMPPEQVKMRHPTDIGHWSDQYSMGVVLYQMLTGKMPFDSDNIPDIYRRILENDPPPPTRYRAEIDPELERIILKALRKDPSKRFASCKEFADALRSWLSRRQSGDLPARTSTVAGGSSALKWVLAILVLAAAGVGVYALIDKSRSGSNNGKPIQGDDQKIRDWNNWKNKGI